MLKAMVFLAFVVITTRGQRKSFHIRKKSNIMITARIDLDNGRMMFQNILNCEQPSILATAISSSGMDSMCCFIRKVANTPARLGRVKANRVSASPKLFTSKNKGITDS